MTSIGITDDEPFCPVVDTFRSIIYAIATLNGDDPDAAVAEHRKWAMEQKAHEWEKGKGELNPKGACHERDTDSAGGNGSNSGHVCGGL